MSFNVQNAGDKDIYVPWTDGNDRKLLRIVDQNGDQIWVHKFHLNLIAGAGGSVDGSGRFKYMKYATIKAIPDDKYEFVEWSDGSKDAERSYCMDQKNDITLTASFKLKGHYVNYYLYDNDTVVRHRQFVEYGQPAVDPGLTLDGGWTHVKWKNNDGGAEFGKPIYEETNYYGRWELYVDLGNIELDPPESSKDSRDIQNLYFPVSGKLSTNIRANGSHAASVNGHKVYFYVRVGKWNTTEYQNICQFWTISPQTKNEPIGIEVPGQNLLNDTYNYLNFMLQKDDKCVVKWTFSGDIVMVLD